MTQPLICSASEPTRIYGSDLDATEGPNHAETSCVYRCYDNNEPQGCTGSFASDDDYFSDEVQISGYCSNNGDQVSRIALTFNSECSVPLFRKGAVILERNENGAWSMKARQQTSGMNDYSGLPWTFCKPGHVFITIIAALQCINQQDNNHELTSSIQELLAQTGNIIAHSPHYEKEDDCATQLSPASSANDVMPMRD